MRRNARRDEVLQAALGIVAREGVGALTIHKLAAQIRASVGGFYRYFPSKEAVLEAVAIRLLEELGTAQRNDLKLTEGALAKQRRGFPASARGLTKTMVAVTVYDRLYRRNPEHHAVLTAVLATSAPALPIEGALSLERALAPLLETVIGHLRETASSGGLREGDPVERTFILWATMHGIGQFRNRDRMVPPAYQSRSLLRAAFRAAFLGFGAAEGDLDVAQLVFQELDAELCRDGRRSEGGIAWLVDPSSSPQ